MADEKWKKVREIFDAALRVEAEERREFVISACGGDRQLRAEVESLLSSLDSAESFMESPAVATVAEAFSGNDKKLEKGHSLGHYKIVRELGSGGMGDVYLATDTKLNRPVALKILRKDLLSDNHANGRL